MSKEEYCICSYPRGTTSNTKSDDWGYRDICCNCGRRLENGFHYYIYYDGEDHYDMVLY